jgi:hypothetical protein
MKEEPLRGATRRAAPPPNSKRSTRGRVLFLLVRADLVPLGQKAASCSCGGCGAADGRAISM